MKAAGAITRPRPLSWRSHFWPRPTEHYPRAGEIPAGSGRPSDSDGDLFPGPHCLPEDIILGPIWGADAAAKLRPPPPSSQSSQNKVASMGPGANLLLLLLLLLLLVAAAAAAAAGGGPKVAWPCRCRHRGRLRKLLDPLVIELPHTQFGRLSSSSRFAARRPVL